MSFLQKLNALRSRPVVAEHEALLLYRSNGKAALVLEDRKKSSRKRYADYKSMVNGNLRFVRVNPKLLGEVVARIRRKLPKGVTLYVPAKSNEADVLASALSNYEDTHVLDRRNLKPVEAKDASGKWEKLNHRRLALLDKEFDGGLTPEESKELKRLEHQADVILGVDMAARFH